MVKRVQILAAIGGLILIAATLASGGEEIVESPGKLTLQMSKEPRLGEIITLTATFTANKNIGHLRVKFGTPLGTKIVSGRPSIDTSITKDETKTFAVQVQFVSAPAQVYCHVLKCITGKDANGKERIVTPEVTGSFIWRVVVDQKTKQLGTEEERNRKFAAEFPEKTDYPLGIHYGMSPQFRNLIQLFLQDEPQLTKLEALWLVDKAEQNYAKDPWGHETAQSAKERDADGTPSVFRRAVERVIDEAKLKSKQTGKPKIIVYREIIEEWKRIRKPE